MNEYIELVTTEVVTEPDDITMLLVIVDGLLSAGVERKHLLAATTYLLTLEPTPAELDALEKATYADYEAELKVAQLPRQTGVTSDEDRATMAAALLQVRDRRLEVIQLAAEALHEAQ
jgi:hypothetical protein